MATTFGSVLLRHGGLMRTALRRAGARNFTVMRTSVSQSSITRDGKVYGAACGCIRLHDSRRFMAASAKNVKILRAETGLAMKVCRQALDETEDNIDAAREWIDQNASARAAKAKDKLGARSATEGRISISTDNGQAYMIEVGCETDFVARNEVMEDLSAKIVAAMKGMASTGAGVTDINVEELLNAPSEGVQDVRESVSLAISSVGENIVLRRAVTMALDGGVIGSYVHGFGSYAALVGVTADGNATGEQHGNLQKLANQIAQQVVAVDPGDGGVDALLQSPYLFDGSMSVQEKIAEEQENCGGVLTITGFLRWGMGQ